MGFGGLIYSIVVLASDVTNLRNRGLAFAFTSSPYMITAFAGSKAAEAFVLNVNIKWGFGAFAIIMPVVTLPTFILLKYYIRKAEKHGIIVREPSGRTLLQNIWHYVVEFDGRLPTHILIFVKLEANIC
jgi:MFS family permease